MLKRALIDKVFDAFAERNQHHGQIQGLIPKKSSQSEPARKPSDEYLARPRTRRAAQYDQANS